MQTSGSTSFKADRNDSCIAPEITRTQVLHSLTGAPRKTREWLSGRYLPGSFWREDEFLWEPAVERSLRDGRRHQLPPTVLGGRRLRHDGSHLKCGFRGAGRAQQLVQDRRGHLRCGPSSVIRPPKPEYEPRSWDSAGAVVPGAIPRIQGSSSQCRCLRLGRRSWRRSERSVAATVGSTAPWLPS